MSLGSEYLADHAYEIEQAQRRWERVLESARMDVKHGIWRTKDGRVMPVEEMETSHIKNCLRMLKRNNNPLLVLYSPMFREELMRRGDEEP